MFKNEEWYGNNIRCFEYEGEWWAVLKDICSALDLVYDDVVQDLSKDTVILIPDSIEGFAVNELGIYEALFSSSKIEAQKFRLWSTRVLQKLRKGVGLRDDEFFKMTDPDIQDEIDHFLETLYWDEEKQCIMQSITVQGGDVEQIPFID